MTALATAPHAPIDAHVDVTYRDTAELMRELLALRDTEIPAPRPMLDALRARGLTRLVHVLDERNVRLVTAS